MFFCAQRHPRYQWSRRWWFLFENSLGWRNRSTVIASTFSQDKDGVHGVQVKLQDLSFDSPQLTQDVRTSHIWSSLMKIFLLQTNTNNFNRQEYSFKVFGTWSTLAFHIYWLLPNQLAIVCDFMSLQDRSDRRVVFRDSRVLYHSLIVYAAIWIVSHYPPACLLYNTPFSQHFPSAFWT